MKHHWQRVTRHNPCTICGKNDWCTYADDFGACCMRIESSRPLKNGGWFHAIDDNSVPIKFEQWHPAQPDPAPNFSALMDRWGKRTDENAVRCLAEELCVSPQSLQSLDCCWSEEHHSWGWPMRDGTGKIIGIRLRAKDGSKFAVRGSKQGLFVPAYLVDALSKNSHKEAREE